MVAFVGGAGLGLFNTSLNVVGDAGMRGTALAGRSGERTYVNTSTGNLVVQRQDEYLAAAGADIAVLRTYNSQGLFTDDNADNWRMGVAKTLGNYVAGVSVTRTDGDGAVLVYAWDGAGYVNKQGDGAFDTLVFNGSTWSWTDGTTGSTETYDWNGASGKMVRSSDNNFNDTVYTYGGVNGSLVTSITSASGEVTYFDYYSGTANLQALRTVKSDGTIIRIGYAYTANRLTHVDVDITPADGVMTDGNKYSTDYSYDAAGNRLTETRQAVSYSTSANGADPSAPITGNLTTSYGYDALGNQTSVTDPAGNVTYTYRDVLGRVTGVAVVSLAQKRTQIAQLYLAILGRMSTAAELTAGRAQDPDALAAALYTSSAALALRPGTDPDAALITNLYSFLLARPPESAAAITYWKAQIPTSDTAGHVAMIQRFIAGVANGMNEDTVVMNSKVAAGLAGQDMSAAANAGKRRVLIAQLYFTVFGRAPDAAGLAYQAATPLTIEQIAQNFYTSPEGQNLYPGTCSDAEVVNRLFLAVYGRSPNASELGTWTTELQNDRPLADGMGKFITRLIASLTGSGVNSPELQMFSNKCTAGLADSVDVNATPGTLTEFSLDVYGNTVLRTDYALGARYATAAGYGKRVDTQDRKTWTVFDKSSTKAIQTVDAQGKSAYASWDAYGNVAKNWRPVTNIGGVQTAYEKRSYDALGRATQIDTGGSVQSITYDGGGRMSLYKLFQSDGSMTDYTTVYNAGDATRVDSITANRGSGPAITYNNYDGNGFIASVTASGSANRANARTLSNDVQGRVLQKIQDGHITRSLIVNGEVMGSSSDSAAPVSETFASNYTPISSETLAQGPSAYTVQAGDTLQSIAKNVWGDANLWYLIADANGTTTVTNGQVITIPGKTNTIANDYQTFTPYSQGKAVGDTTPILPAPKKKSNWLKQLIMIVIVVIVAIYTAGALAASGALGSNAMAAATLAGTTTGGGLGATMAAGMSVMGGAAGAGAAAAAGALGAAAGSVAGQGFALASGMQDKFSWKQVGLSAIGGGISSGLAGANIIGGDVNSLGNFAARAAIGNVASQGVGIVTGLQKSFDWRGVAASAVGAGVGQAVGGAMGMNDPGFASRSFGEQFGARLVTGLAAGTAAAVMRGGKVAVQQVAVDSFGNALGNSLAESVMPNPTRVMGAGRASDAGNAGQGLRMTQAQVDGWASSSNAADPLTRYALDAYAGGTHDDEVAFSTSVEDRRPYVVGRMLSPMAPVPRPTLPEPSAGQYVVGTVIEKMDGIRARLDAMGEDPSTSEGLRLAAAAARGPGAWVPDAVKFFAGVGGYALDSQLRGQVNTAVGNFLGNDPIGTTKYAATRYWDDHSLLEVGADAFNLVAGGSISAPLGKLGGLALRGSVATMAEAGEAALRWTQKLSDYSIEFTSVNNAASRYQAGALGLTIRDLRDSGSFAPNAPYVIRYDPMAPGRPDPRFSIDSLGFKTPTSTTSNGGLRSAGEFWRQWLDLQPDSIGSSNRYLIDNFDRLKVSPRVDETWIKIFPEHGSYMRDVLVHHHVDFGQYAIPVPGKTHVGSGGPWHLGN